MTTSAAVARPAPRISLELDSPELAAAYDEVGTRQFLHGKVLIQSVGAHPGERVLDVGCGTGRLGQYVAELVAPGGAVFGIDPLPLRVEIAARKHPLFRASVGRAEDLSAFADQSFDLVYANSVFHWVADKPRALREALRVLKPGGRIALNSADGDRAHQSVGLVRDALLEEGLTEAAAAREGGHNYRVNAAELQALLQGAGFEFGCDPLALANPAVFRAMSDRVIAQLGLHVLGAPLVHQFPAPGGITGLYLLSESHWAWHTYPESELATFNLYCCRAHPPLDWPALLAGALGAQRVEVTSVRRGLGAGSAARGPAPFEPVRAASSQTCAQPGSGK